MNLSVPSLLDATLEDIREGLDTHAFTSSDLVEAYLYRIVEVNKQLGAVIELNPDAIADAERCDSERAEPLPSSSSSSLSLSSSLSPSSRSSSSLSARNRANVAAAAASATRSPLHGIPLLLNDNIATADRMSTSAGSCVLQGARVGEPSTIEAKLRAAGAILLGKTNMSELGGIRGHDVPEGWSGRGGQTFGAYFPRQNPRGASSGSAVAASIGLAWAAVATDTDIDGSLIMPADAGNVVGLRPTVGLTSRHLVIPVSRHLDTVGAVARTVRDAAYVLAAIAGVDPRDEHTRLIPYQQEKDNHQNKDNHKDRINDSDGADAGLPDYVAACQLSGLRGKRIGVPRRSIAALMKGLSGGPDLETAPGSTSDHHHPNSSPDPDRDNGPRPPKPRHYDLPPGALDKVVDVLRSAGADIIDDDDNAAHSSLDLSGPLAHLALPPAHRYPLERISFMADLPSRYLSKTTHNPDAIDSLDRLLHFTRAHPHERYPSHDTSAWEDALSRAMLHGPSALSSDWELHYLQRLSAFDEHGLPALLSRLRLDAILCPAPVAEYLASPVGLPVLTVPVGCFPDGTPEQRSPWPGLVDVAPNRPFGMSLVGPKFSEATLLRVGYALEQGTRARRAVHPLVRPGPDLKDIVAERLALWPYPDGET